ncbi:MAG: thiamine-phosphate kinase [Candidatus Thermoplasmatota archaeon]|nr:thiamine-phosphate kinase [Candidatus Thermoplasmatota archaeon]
MKRLSDLGERKAIQLIHDILSSGDEAIGIGDDCAAFEFGEKYLLVSTDMITAETHIHKKMTPWQVGWFVVAINLSDIAAKGGKPLGLVLSLGLPRSTSDIFLKELMEGADSCATMHGTSIVGGDTKENPNVTICGTVFGIVKKNEFMSRKGAKPGDVVAITGTLGKAGVGHYALQHSIENEEITKGLFEPSPRLEEGMVLAGLKMINSCMDISDGLSSSLYQLQELNNVGFEIEKKRIPLAKDLVKLANQENLDAYEYGLHFGGDYELLLTVYPDKFEKVKRSIEKAGTSLTAIGHVTKNRKIHVVDGGSKKILSNGGYEHFR